MKKLSTYLFLLLFSFQTTSWADAISDFQIEGISIGDSLLDFFSKNEIDNFITNQYPSSDKYEMMLIVSSKFKVYDMIQIEYLKNNSNYIIESLSGKIEFPHNIDKCINKRDEISGDIKNTFNNLIVQEYKPTKHSPNYPNSVNYETQLNLKNGDKIRLYCIDWSVKVEKEKRYTDDLSVDISTKKFLNWLNNEAFK